MITTGNAVGGSRFGGDAAGCANLDDVRCRERRKLYTTTSDRGDGGRGGDAEEGDGGQALDHDRF